MKKLIFLLIFFVMFICVGCNNIGTKNIEENKYSKEVEIKNSKDDILKNSNEINNKDTKENITIVIDPGHSSKSDLEKEPISPNSNKLIIKDDGGVIGTYTKVPEYKTCMSISLILKDLLERSGFNVIMTKTDNDISMGNIDRAKIGNNVNANLVIRIHTDSDEDSSQHGATICIPKIINKSNSGIYDISRKYGNTIIDTYCSKTHLVNKGIVSRDDITAFNWSKVPVVLLKIGFLSNKYEDKFLSNEDNHQNIARAIYDGISKCFSQN